MIASLKNVFRTTPRVSAWRALLALALLVLCLAPACTAVNGLLEPQSLGVGQTPSPTGDRTSPTGSVDPAAPASPEPLGTEGTGAAALPEPQKAEVTFVVEIPLNTPLGEPVYLSVLDEVTGLALNAQNYRLEPDQTDIDRPRTYTLTLPFALGSTVKYRYERQADAIRVAEHTSDGSPVRYRMLHVQAPAVMEDVVSRWTDTEYMSAGGRIQGTTVDSVTGEPLPNLLILAGGQQTRTTSDGSFLLEGLPPGVHNLVAFAPDGSYRSFQQGARVAENSTTPAPLALEPSPLVEVMFVVSLPEDTPPIVPVRMAGSLSQLGNAFASLSGGVNGLADHMPVLEALPDGRYTITLQLPVGADIRYKYTLGDGFWNAEHTAQGAFRLRQLVIPDHDTLIEDQVETWHSGSQEVITFDISVPENTPPGDIVYIQFNPLFGWTEPIPMWSLGGNRWAYKLYSPLNLPGNLTYRYCRNAQCGRADDVATPGLYGAGRPVNMAELPQMFKDEVNAWTGLPSEVAATEIPTTTIQSRQDDFVAGIELEAGFHPSWASRLPGALEDIQSLGANWLVLSPTWTFTRQSPPVLSPISGQDALWPDLEAMIQESQASGFQVAVFPQPRFSQDPAEWWQESLRDFPWWVVWFEHYRVFLLHHADLAARNDAAGLVLGGVWLAPALPGGVLADGSPSGVPSDAESRWRNLIAEVRSRYEGPIFWALPFNDITNPPHFLDAIDQVYLLWTVAPQVDAESGPVLPGQAELDNLLDIDLRSLQFRFNKPFVLAVSASSSPDLTVQFEAYHLLLQEVAERDWITGFVSRGYYPPVVVQDESPSIHGKPAADLLKYWFSNWLNAAPPQP